MSDQSKYRTDKYNVTRTDGQEVGRTFVIEIDRDPDAQQLLYAVSEVYHVTRPELSDSLRKMAEDMGCN